MYFNFYWRENPYRSAARVRQEAYSGETEMPGNEFYTYTGEEDYSNRGFKTSENEGVNKLKTKTKIFQHQINIIVALFLIAILLYLQSKLDSNFTSCTLQSRHHSDFTRSTLHCKQDSIFQEHHQRKERTLEDLNKQHFINLCMSFIELMIIYCLTNYIREIPKGEFNENTNQEQRSQNKGTNNSRKYKYESRNDYNDNNNDNSQNSNRNQLQEDEGKEGKVGTQTKIIMFNILNIYDDSEEEYESTKTMIYKTYNTK